MVGINTYTSLSSSSHASSTSAAKQTQSVPANDKAGALPTSSTGGNVSTVSKLALQLSEAATRAESRVSNLEPKALGQKATALLDKIAGDSYHLNEAKHAAEVPDTDDPELLARAKQASSFVNGSGSNPFKGMSRDQLALITYDEGDTFTVNERRAAYVEAFDQESVWRQKVTAQAMDEYNRTSKLTNFFSAVLERYESLPSIEKSQYPEDYAADLQEKIDLDFNDMTHKAEGKGNSVTSLIEKIVSASPENRKEAKSATLSAAQQATSAVQPASAPTPASSVTKTNSSAGYDLMVSRLFGGRESTVANGAQGMSTSNISRSAYEFLTREDRALVADMYVYAQAQGADLMHVDRLAGELGEYRQHDNGRLSLNFNNGTNYDVQGRQLTVNFNEQDSATAARILNGSAISSTRIDQGFLNHILDPGYGALTNTSDLGFLEQMVTKFSNEGSSQSSLDSRFANYTPVASIKDKIVLSASESMKLKPFEPDIANVNGVWTVTDKGAAAGITLDQVTGTSQRSNASIAGLEQNRYILDAFFSTKEQNASRPAWLSSLLERFSTTM